MKPMLAMSYKGNLSANVFPGWVQPKYDGIRCLLSPEGITYTRSLKQIPNEYIRHMFFEVAQHFEHNFYLDGELTIKDPQESDYNKTQSTIMSHHKDPAHLVYTIFDVVLPDEVYVNRMAIREELFRKLQGVMPWLRNSVDYSVLDAASLESTAEDFLQDGHEGAIYRHTGGLYKFGRSTARQGYLIKLKQFTDAEAIIIGFEELMHNKNEAFKNELGYTAHSSHKENLIPGNTLGRLVCAYEGLEIRVGTGFSDAMRKHIWDNRPHFAHKMIKFKYMSYGTLEKPRHPVFLGFRDERDIDVVTPAVGSG